MTGAELLRAVGVALCGVTASVVLRGFGKKDFALVCEIICGLVLLGMAVDALCGAMDGLAALTERAQLDDSLLQLLLRVSGVTVAAELAAQLCRDAGAGALAQKLELVGKAVILCACLPVLVQLCDVALSLLA